MSAFVSHTLRTGLIAAGLALGMASLAPAFAQTSPAAPAADGIIAKGNGFTVTEDDLRDLADEQPPGLDTLPEDQRRAALIDYVISLKAITGAAQAAKVEQSQEFSRKFVLAKQQLLVQTYLDQEVKKRVTPEAMRKLYDESIKGLKPVPEVRARHILVSTEAEAKVAIDRLKKGEDFAKIAAEVSKDPGAKKDGGELDFFAKDQMVAPFSEAAFKLEPKQISEPVQTSFGWHVIQVEEKRDRPVPGFEDLKAQLEDHLARQEQQKLISEIRTQANVQRLDKPAAPPADTATPAKK